MNSAPDTFTICERRIMEILYRRRRATAREVLSDILGPQSYSTVRTQLRVLEKKGHVQHALLGGVHVYRPVVPRRRAQRAALRRMIDVFFDGSADAARDCLARHFKSTPISVGRDNKGVVP
jgi:BlaI family transcriptional regulator, penicillinase repressor